MTRFTKFISILGTASLVIFSGCSLDEHFRQAVDQKTADNYTSGGSASFDALLGTVYADLQPFMSQDRIWALQDVTTDEMIVPTRATNWGDGGKWRSLHAHRWDADHEYIRTSFSDLLTGVYDATVILSFDDVPADVAAKARFMRAFYLFHTLDNFGKFPYREPNSDPLQLPKVYEAAEGIDFVISEVEAVINDLPDGPLPGQANKDAARMLLAKLYLNRGTFLDRTNPTFPTADMDKVIEYTDQIISSGHYQLMDKYFDNFTPNNGQVSTELIFTEANVEGVPQGVGNGIQSRWFCTLHYNMNPGGWNGFATLSEFYDKFEDNDIRKSYTDPDVKALGGPDLGFLIGQQYDKDGNPLKDASGKNVVFTKDVSLIERGDNLDFAGVRVLKYTPDYASNGIYLYAPNNDYVFFRYGDVLLMKAEALLRKGNAADALSIVNDLRAKRISPASPLSALTLDDMLDERGRELYWEGWRRQDQIRFGTYLNDRPTKPQSDPKYLLFPIPNSQLAVNPNLKQNPGY